MNRVKEHKALAEAIAPYGLTMVKDRKHFSIRDREGNYVTSVSHSPSDPHFARQTIRQLVRIGRVPETLKGVKI